MAFLASGHGPDAGRYGPVVRGAVDYLLSQAQPDGYFGKAHGKGMYDQGIVTLALAEAYGVEPDAGRRARMYAELTKAVKVILAAQAVPKPEPMAGGWRYLPASQDSDLSLSGWNALALRAARNVGVEAPKEAVDRAVAFVARCYNAEAKGFAYQPGGAAQVGPTGVGVLSLYLLAGGDRPEAGPAMEFLQGRPVNEGTPFQYYSMYYVTQAAFQAGEPRWSGVALPALNRLLAMQLADGGWPQQGQEPGGAYAASMALLTLSVPYRLLPVYQR
jgi:hypothetical protein